MKTKIIKIILIFFAVALVSISGFLIWSKFIAPPQSLKTRQQIKQEVIQTGPRGTDTSENIPAIEQAKEELKQFEATANEQVNKDAVTLRKAADNYYLAGQLDKAIETYLQETKLNPNDGVLWRKLGDCYRENLEYEKAIETYKKSISLEPINNLSYYNMADIYQINLKKPKDAKKVYEALLAAEPNNEVAKSALKNLN